MDAINPQQRLTRNSLARSRQKTVSNRLYRSPFIPSALPGRYQQEALLALLQQNKEPLPAIKQAVLQGAENLLSSPDWFELQIVLSKAAGQRSSSVSSQCKETDEDSARKLTRTGSSPWGSALRQPGVRPRATQTAPGSTPQAQQLYPLDEQGQQQQAPPTPLWNWQAVQHFRVLGLGPIASPVSSSSQVGNQCCCW